MNYYTDTQNLKQIVSNTRAWQGILWCLKWQFHLHFLDVDRKTMSRWVLMAGAPLIMDQ